MGDIQGHETCASVKDNNGTDDVDTRTMTLFLSSNWRELCVSVIRGHDNLWSRRPLYDIVWHRLPAGTERQETTLLYVFRHTAALRLVHTCCHILPNSSHYRKYTCSTNSPVIPTSLATPRPTEEHCSCVDYLWPCFFLSKVGRWGLSRICVHIKWLSRNVTRFYCVRK